MLNYIVPCECSLHDKNWIIELQFCVSILIPNGNQDSWRVTLFTLLFIAVPSIQLIAISHLHWKLIIIISDFILNQRSSKFASLTFLVLSDSLIKSVKSTWQPKRKLIIILLMSLWIKISLISLNFKMNWFTRTTDFFLLFTQSLC